MSQPRQILTNTEADELRDLFGAAIEAHGQVFTCKPGDRDVASAAYSRALQGMHDWIRVHTEAPLPDTHEGRMALLEEIRQRNQDC